MTRWHVTVIALLLTLTPAVPVITFPLSESLFAEHHEFASAEALVADGAQTSPSAPTALAATVVGSTVGLTWSPPTDGPAPTGYLLEAALTSGGPVFASLPVATVGVSVPGVPNGSYFLRVRAVNADGVSEPSNEVGITVGLAACASPPMAPTDLAGMVAGTLVSLAWTAPPAGCAPTGYTVRAGSAPGLVNLVALPVGAAAGLQANAPSGVYHVTVTAQNAFGSSGPSNEIALTVGPTCTLPGAPSSFAAGSSGSTASMTWAPPLTGGVAASYRLEAGSIPGAANLAVLPLTGLTFSTSAPPGTYYLRVRAQNACGIGPPSSEHVLTMTCIAPGRPAAPSASVTGSAANLSWTAVAGASSYRLTVGTAVGAANVLNTVVTGTTRHLSGLAAGTYFVQVAAINGCGTGPASGTSMFSITAPPTTPSCGGVPAPGMVACGVPTARCNNGDWSCSQNRSGTCSRNGGVACWVCPGRLC